MQINKSAEKVKIINKGNIFRFKIKSQGIRLVFLKKIESIIMLILNSINKCISLFCSIQKIYEKSEKSRNH